MRGKLIQNDVHLEEHEWKTVKTLLDKGYNIELVKPSEIKESEKVESDYKTKGNT